MAAPPKHAPKRVLIVEDSLVVREYLASLIGEDPRLKVVSVVSSGEEALRVLREAQPDVITMDIRLPGMNGLETTKRIMAERPTPIVVVAGSINSDDLNISMNALRAGALSVIEKPVGLQHQDYAAVAARLCTQLVLMSEVRCIRQKLSPSPEPAAVARRPARTLQNPPAASAPGTYRLLGIVASTGGPNAIVKVLCGIGPDFPLPIVLVQHITATFLSGFVSWLNDVCPQPVTEAEEGQRLVAGQVYVAPPERHLTVDSHLRVHLEDSAPICVQRPSGTVLFHSMASALGPRALGVLLTGMGEDGAAGLLRMREAGGFTIAEAESTAVVYGMPAAAVRLGAVCESLAIDDVAPRLKTLAGGDTASTT